MIYNLETKLRVLTWIKPVLLNFKQTDTSLLIRKYTVISRLVVVKPFVVRKFIICSL